MHLIEKTYGNCKSELINVYESEVIDAFIMDNLNLERNKVIDDLRNLSCYSTVKLHQSGVDEYDYEIIVIEDDEHNFQHIEEKLFNYEKELMKEL